MSATQRQSDLFAGEIWTALYQAFPSINFNATDPVSINQALVNYIQINYPEQFNDWIISSEFVAIIDLLSWLAGTLAFKTDIAARENFLDTAEARASILRLARFLSYNPSRCYPASGVLKITSISTNDDVLDSFGVDLINTSIIWNDPNNSNWYEQFTAVLNNALVNTNPFGVPISEGTVSNLATQLYRLNGLASATSLGFTETVSGTAMDFEICNGNFSDGGTLFEIDPNPTNAFQFFYLNDGNGNSSNQTGFFLLFKQGTTQSQVFNIAVPVLNQLINITTTNINQTDVWVDTVDDNGNVTIDWTNVPAIFNSNITYNNIPISQRNIFSVITRENDQVTIRFSDGIFGNAPTGNIQVTFRVSNGLAYVINPLEIDNIQIPFSFINPNGAQRTLYVNFSLLQSVTNASAAETISQIKQRASQVYGTQARMVSGQDYNSYPLSTNLAVKIQAVNRIYSGQSRYIDLHDPTGTYQDLSIFAEDGIFFQDPTSTYFEVPSALNYTSSQILSNYILPALNQYTTTNVIMDVLLQNTRYITSTVPTVQWSSGTLIDVSGLGITWTTSNADLFQTTGWFSQLENLIQPGALIQFNIAGVPTWVAVIDIAAPINVIPPSGTAGPVTLAQEVATGSTVIAVVPSVYVQPSASVISSIQTNLGLNLSFSLWYDFSNSNSANGPTWVVQAPENDFGAPEPALVGTMLQIMNVNYNTAVWQITSIGLRYVFESVADVQFFDNGTRALAQLTNEAEIDLIRLLRINANLNDVRGYALPMDYYLALDRVYTYPDGTPETRRSTVLFYDSNGDGYPDYPDTFYKIVSNTTENTYLFWSNAADPPYVEPLYTVVVYDTDTLRAAATPAIGTVGFQITSAASYLNDTTFWVYTSGGWQQDVYNVYSYEIGRGPNIAVAWNTSGGPFITAGDELIFQWRHYATTDYRIDPACTNINDIFVLTFAYDTAVRNWITNGASIDSMPTPPTELDLGLAFASLEEFKMFSDQIVWRPVRYKFLFGNGANSELKAQFKVVRITNTSVSNGEIQTQIINAINAFFAITNWDFGETFFATELLAYIHQQLSGLISSIVIVPESADGVFGDLFQITCGPDEIFISTAQVSDVIIINSNTAVSLRIR